MRFTTWASKHVDQFNQRRITTITSLLERTVERYFNDVDDHFKGTQRTNVQNRGATQFHAQNTEDDIEFCWIVRKMHERRDTLCPRSNGATGRLNHMESSMNSVVNVHTMLGSKWSVDW